MIFLLGLGVGCSFTIISLLFGVVNLNNVEAESKSFFECYTTVSSTFLLFNQLTPVTVNLTDPKMKAYISNFCNFYHEKTGIWIDSFSDPRIDYDTLGKEFNQTYGSTMPDSMKEFANMSIFK